MKGFVQVYTGDGKGKTTAALGLLLRACGADLHVYLGQFIKGRKYCEITSIQKRFPEVTVRQFGAGCFIRRAPSTRDMDLARDGLEQTRRALLSGKFDLVIADEINCCVTCRLLSYKDVLSLIEARPAKVELVLTGRDAHPKVLEKADLITEMKEIRHYYRKGVKARRGIEC